jgi:diaminopimelate decarboxylase
MAHLAHDPHKKPDGRTARDLGKVLPHTACVNSSGNLELGGVDLVDLAKSQGTALYVMDEEHIRVQLRRYRAALNQNGVVAEVAFAGKAFLARYMAALVNEEQAWLDVSGGGELYIALSAGFPAEHIVVHGNNKTVRELSEAIEAGAGRIVVDSALELERVNELAAERGVVQPIFLRVKPGVVADTHEFIQTGAEDSKFGFGLADNTAQEAAKRAAELPHVDLKGLHVHIGSQIFALSSFARVIEVMVEFLALLKQSYSIELTELDLGGGLGIAYAPEHEPPSVEEFGALITQSLTEQCARHELAVPRILVEPGRSIVANAGLTLYTVGCVKDLPGIRTYVAIDGGMTDNIRTALYDAHYEAVVANKADQPRDAIVTLAGKHCESGDVVAVDTALQTPATDDIVCVFSTGAYCYTMASNYNKQPRPAVYFVRDGQARHVVRRESYEDLINCDIF